MVCLLMASISLSVLCVWVVTGPLKSIARRAGSFVWLAYVFPSTQLW